MTNNITTFKNKAEDGFFAKFSDHDEEIDKLKDLRVDEQAAHIEQQAARIERLKKAGQHFANFARSDGRETCECHNCKLRDIINETTSKARQCI